MIFGKDGSAGYIFAKADAADASLLMSAFGDTMKVSC